MEELFDKLKIKPSNLKLYETAFTHSSYVNEHKEKEDYERLEFLGDAVDDLVISDYLMNNTKLEEGDMTKVRASYVCESALYRYATDLELPKYIRVGHGEKVRDGEHNQTICADIFEALIGAIYLDLGYEVARECVLSIIVPYIEDESITFFSDYKSALQEAVQADKKSVEYKLIEEEGPAHDKKYTVEVVIEDIVYGTGSGKSKKEAEQKAAEDALRKLVIN